MHYVYYLLDPDTQDLLYIGRSTDPRVRAVAFTRRTGRPTIMGICQRHSTLESASQAELKAITKHWPPFNKRLHSGRSSTGCGASMLGNKNAAGHKWTEAEKERIRRQQRGNTAHLGHKHSPETKARYSLTRRGLKQSISSNVKRSQTLKGRIFTDEQKAKISAGLKLAWSRKNAAALPNN